MRLGARSFVLAGLRCTCLMSTVVKRVLPYTILVSFMLRHLFFAVLGTTVVEGGTIIWV